MVFQFDIVDLGQPAHNRYDPYPVHLPDLKAGLKRMQSLSTDTDGWCTSFLENHDQGEHAFKHSFLSSRFPPETSCL